MANSWADLLGIGGKALVDGLGKGSTVTPTFTPGPLFPTGQAATNDWWNTLQQWQNDPSGNYGAIAPDWNDIWNQTQKQVKNYYEGSALQPGVQSQIDSSLAQRGMSDQPASDFLHAQVGAAEAQNLGSLSAEQNIAQNQFAEQGRQTWLSSLQSLQNQTTTGPGAGEWNTVVQPNQTQQLVGAIAPVAAAAVGAAATGGASTASNAYLSSLLSSQQNPSAYNSTASAPVGNYNLSSSPLVTNGWF